METFRLKKSFITQTIFYTFLYGLSRELKIFLFSLMLFFVKFCNSFDVFSETTILNDLSPQTNPKDNGITHNSEPTTDIITELEAVAMISKRFDCFQNSR